MGECVFCAIAAGRQPASIVHRGLHCLAFMDIRPINPGHALVIPLSHAGSLSELDQAAGAALFAVAHRIAVALRNGALAALDVRCDGVNLLLSDGPVAGQMVDHIHLHVVPRFRGDGAGFRRGAVSAPRVTRSDLKRLAHALADRMGDVDGARSAPE